MAKTVVVSAFFNIPSKRPYSVYIEHLNRWFRSIRCPVIFFTTPDVWKDILSMDLDISHLQVRYETIDEWKAWELGRAFWEKQKARDREPYHTPELAAIWYEKKEFVKRAFEMSDASVFIWCDAGCVRDDTSEEAMREFGLRNFPLDDDRIHVQHIREQPYKPWYVHPEYRYAGAIIAGNRNAWMRFDDIYRRVLYEYDVYDISCNSDQYIMASCKDREPAFFYEHMLHPNDTINEWFFLLSRL